MGAREAGAPVQTLAPAHPPGGPINRRAHSFAATDGEDGPTAIEVVTPPHWPPSLQILEPPLSLDLQKTHDT